MDPNQHYNDMLNHDQQYAELFLNQHYVIDPNYNPNPEHENEHFVIPKGILILSACLC